MDQNLTEQSSEPEASSVGSAAQKSTDQMRLECASYSCSSDALATSHTHTTPARGTGRRGGVSCQRHGPVPFWLGVPWVCKPGKRE